MAFCLSTLRTSRVSRPKDVRGNYCMPYLHFFSIYWRVTLSSLYIHLFIFKATLIALRKRERGFWVIAVFLTLRCLVAKIGCAHIVQSAGSILALLQLDFGVPSGCEAAAHAAHQYLASMLSDHVLHKIDFKNAFNSLRRDRILEAVQSSFPELYHLSSQHTGLLCTFSVVTTSSSQRRQFNKETH